MEIQEGKYLLRNDSDTSYTLAKKRTRGEESVWADFAWYDSMDAALKDLTNRLIRTSDASSWEELATEVRRIHNRLAEIRDILEKGAERTQGASEGAMSMNALMDA